MLAAASAVQSLDYTAVATNLGILVGFLVATIAGIRKGIALLKKAPAKNTPPGAAAPAILASLDHLLLRELADSNRAVVQALAETRSALYNHRDSLSDHGAQLTGLAHQIERLRDKM